MKKWKPLLLIVLPGGLLIFALWWYLNQRKQATAPPMQGGAGSTAAALKAAAVTQPSPLLAILGGAASGAGAALGNLLKPLTNALTGNSGGGSPLKGLGGSGSGKGLPDDNPDTNPANDFSDLGMEAQDESGSNDFGGSGSSYGGSYPDFGGSSESFDVATSPGFTDESFSDNYFTEYSADTDFGDFSDEGGD